MYTCHARIRVTTKEQAQEPIYIPALAQEIGTIFTIGPRDFDSVKVPLIASVLAP
jgi:hypothetical protein